ncbi:MAG: glycine cleavage system protein GcvH [Bacillota bacterium]
MKMYPEDLLYTENHEWIRVEDGIGVVGITEYACEQLGDLVFVELPEEGDEFGQGDSFGVIESVKAVADFYLPAGGTVVEVNEDLLDAPETITEDPYGEGWVIKIEISDSSELDVLMNSEDYQTILD